MVYNTAGVIAAVLGLIVLFRLSWFVSDWEKVTQSNFLGIVVIFIFILFFGTLATGGLMILGILASGLVLPNL
jgi:hypothetical protein